MGRPDFGAETSDSARFPGMPQSAAASGAVDQVLTAADIARRLGYISRHPKVTATAVESDGLPAERAPDDLEKIFKILRAHKQVDFAGYKHTTIRRRIARRMGMRRAASVEKYGDLLEQDAKEVDDLFKDLLINVTGFFRDRPVFQALTRQFLPRIIQEKKKTGELRIWIPGCATGQEVYSLGICVHEVLSRMKAKMDVQIFGTDLSEAAISKARAGIYLPDAVREVPAEKLRRYFVRKNGGHPISRTIRDLCTFARQKPV